MKVFRYNADGKISVGLEVNGTQYDCSHLMAEEPTDVRFAVEQGDVRKLIETGFFERASVQTAGVKPMESVEEKDFLAPIQNPEKIICIGLNYLDHCEEQNKPQPEYPLLFAKFPNTITTPTADVVIPPNTDLLDFEGEFGVVIGKTGKNVSRENAMDYVWGYVAINDVTARDLQKKDGQWVRAKSQDGFAPMGPYVVHRSLVEDPHNIPIKTTFNGKLMQDGNTNNLIFRIPELIEFITEGVTLQPGDIISTGTPAGVGIHRNPPVVIRDGDVVEIVIDGIGKVKNRFVNPKR